MSLLIKNWSEGNWKELLKWAKIGANNAMIGEFTEVEELPPHGRLIDAEEKIKVQIYDDMFEDYRTVEMTIDALLKQGWIEAKAPTIIPAEEGET